MFLLKQIVTILKMPMVLVVHGGAWAIPDELAPASVDGVKAAARHGSSKPRDRSIVACLELCGSGDAKRFCERKLLGAAVLECNLTRVGNVIAARQSDKDPMFGSASTQFNLLENEDPAFQIAGSANHRSDRQPRMSKNTLIRGRPGRRHSKWLSKSFLIEKGVKGAQQKKELTLGGRININDLDSGLWLNPTVVLRRLTVTIGGFKIELLPGPSYTQSLDTVREMEEEDQMYVCIKCCEEESKKVDPEASTEAKPEALEAQDHKTPHKPRPGSSQPLASGGVRPVRKDNTSEALPPHPESLSEPTSHTLSGARDQKHLNERYTDPWERQRNIEDKDHHGRHSYHKDSYHDKKNRHHDREREKRYGHSDDDKYKERSKHHGHSDDRHSERRKERHHSNEYSSHHKDRHRHRRDSDYENGRRSSKDSYSS
ncbi:hypothetical protein GOODEAATRI_011308 [Goodea atripinnis]|uniref:Uncharacterized protein n=1 Tax=Goodea atripinnis TaxID=208336 RepID=A0ABV0PDC2_9TELE